MPPTSSKRFSSYFNKIPLVYHGYKHKRQLPTGVPVLSSYFAFELPSRRHLSSSLPRSSLPLPLSLSLFLSLSHQPLGEKKRMFTELWANVPARFLLPGKYN